MLLRQTFKVATFCLLDASLKRYGITIGSLSSALEKELLMDSLRRIVGAKKKEEIYRRRSRINWDVTSRKRVIRTETFD